MSITHLLHFYHFDEHNIHVYRPLTAFSEHDIQTPYRHFVASDLFYDIYCNEKKYRLYEVYKPCGKAADSKIAIGGYSSIEYKI